MSCNTKTSLAAVIDAVNAQLNNNYVDRDDPRIDQGVFTEPTIRGGLMLDEAAKLDFCGYVDECGLQAPFGKQWVDRPLYPDDMLVSYDEGGEIKAKWQGIEEVIAASSDTTLREDITEGRVVTAEMVKTVPPAGGLARTLQDRNLDTLTVKDFGAKGDGVTDDSDAFQAAVNHSINNGTKSLFVPFGHGEIYRLGKPVLIECAGYRLWGDRAPTYLGRINNNLSAEVGYITADDNVKDFFIYNNKSDKPNAPSNEGLNGASNQVVVENIGAMGKGKTLGQTFMKHYTNNNGPHRGVGFHGVSGAGLANVFRSTSDVWSDGTKPYGACSIVMDKSCVFWRCGNVVLADENSRTLQMRVSGIQSEQGAAYKGNIDGGITFTDNMLEGQNEAIDIAGIVPVFKAEHNYFEAMGGRFAIGLKSSSSKGSYTRGHNFVDSLKSPDYVRLSGTMIVNTLEPSNLPSRFTDETAYGLLTGFNSVGDGRFYVPVDYTASNTVLSGWISAANLGTPNKEEHTVLLGNETFKTPFGNTPKGLTIKGFNRLSRTLSTNSGIKSGDIIVLCALVQCSIFNSPILELLGDNSTLGGYKQARVTDTSSENDWKILHVVLRAPKDITLLTVNMQNTETTLGDIPQRIRDRMGGKSPADFFNYKAASLGYYVIKPEDFVSVGDSNWAGTTAELRAEVQLFNPLVQETALIRKTELRKVSATVSIPAKGWATVVSSTSLYYTDFTSVMNVTASVDTQGIQFHARKVEKDRFVVDAFNPTDAPIDLGTIDLYVSGTVNGSFD